MLPLAGATPEHALGTHVCLYLMVPAIQVEGVVEEMVYLAGSHAIVHVVPEATVEEAVAVLPHVLAAVAMAPTVAGKVQAAALHVGTLGSQAGTLDPATGRQVTLVAPEFS